MEVTNQNTPNNEGFRKLKKIKRPIRRFEPGNPVQPNPQQNAAGHSSVQPLNASGNLDELLDNQLNLPSISNKPNVQPRLEENQLPPRQRVNRDDQNNFITEEDLYPQERFIDTLMVDNMFTAKGVVLIAVLVLILGIVFAKLVFGGKTVVKDGLQGVVVNAEVPRGRARCGVAERTQGCVLYIMNPQRRDLQGRDFYDLASQLTGRQRFVVETGNMRYSSVKIRPGDIAQINIPPLQ